MPYLIEDIKSSCRPSHYYGYEGDEVEIVSDNHGNVVIVEDLEGNVFPVPADKLSTIQSKTIQTTEQLILNTVAAKKTRNVAALQLPSLF